MIPHFIPNILYSFFSGEVKLELRKRTLIAGALFSILAIGLAVIITVVIASPASSIESVSASTDGALDDDAAIKVHGVWTIDVLDESGHLVTRREFENALTSRGSEFLASFLASSSTSGRWRIVLDNITTGGESML
jgi:hypothetical protein